MAIELKLNKTDNTPWGFRLTGGADCDVPHTVVKVVEGSIADASGLKVGDVIVRINEHSVTDCTHLEVNQIIFEAEQQLIFGVRRDYYSHEDIQEDENNNLEVSNIMTGTFAQQTEFSATNGHKSSTSSVTDELIAEAISGEAEVLPDQNILGVNFNKIDLSQSTILTVMEAQKSEETMELKERKWSAFLQKPERPVLKPKPKNTEESKAPPYQVVIKKQKKKKLAVDLKAFSPEPEENENQFAETIDDQVQESENADNEETTAESCNEIDLSEEDNIEDKHEMIQDDIETLEADEDNEVIEHNQIQQETDIQLSVDEQLAQVQIQLQALAQMPSSIQDTLESVTKQLTKILNATQLRTEEEEVLDSAHASRGDSFERSFQETAQEETGYCADEKDNSEAEEEYRSNVSENSDRSFQEEIDEVEDTPIKEFEEETIEPEINEEELERLRIETEKSVQKERNITVVEESHQRRLDQRPTNPLAPIQRPIILPGGRKWAQPDDAVPVRKKKSSMSDEKICETLDTYSETIVGRTKGLTNGTPFGHGVTT